MREAARFFLQCLLQWGHDLSAVETASPMDGLAYGVTASMGPRPFSRGNVGPAFFRRRVGMLQWGHDLSAVETTAVRVHRYFFIGASMGPRPFSRGNAELSRCRPSGLAASMGPRPFSRGNNQAIIRVGDLTSGLQWGHDLSAVETVRGPQAGSTNREASMGPRPFSRGNSGSVSRPYIRPTCFNGATTFQPWKLFTLMPCTTIGTASMGPRPFSRGNHHSLSQS